MCHDTHMMWKELETLFAYASEDRCQLLGQKLHNLYMRKCQSIQTHMPAVRNLINQLSNCNDTLKNWVLITLMLISLPTSWWVFDSYIKASIVHNTYMLLHFFTLFIDEKMTWEVRSNRTEVSTESLIASTQRSRQDKQQFYTYRRRYISFQQSSNDRDYHKSDKINSSNRDHNEFHNCHNSRDY